MGGSPLRFNVLAGWLLLLTLFGCIPEIESADGDGDGVADGDDCAEKDPAVFPGAVEVCDGVDQDCDGEIDEALTTPFYADTDGDSFGDPTQTIDACTLPEGYTDDTRDCDDADPNIYPGAVEHCDSQDQDCDGEADNNADDAPTWHLDADADSHGDPLVATQSCAAPSGYVASADDCDDREASAFPGGEEVCDGLDNNCDGVVDTLDLDGDGSQPLACGGDDCDDSSAAVGPHASEICTNNVDDDCDGTTNGCGLEGVVEDTDADVTLLGDPDAFLGVSVGPAGDANVDGDDDLWVGAIGADGIGADNTGMAYLVSHPRDGAVAQSMMLAGSLEGGALGYCVTGLDWNGDGVADVAVGEPDLDNLGDWGGSGAVYVLLGPFGQEIAIVDSNHEAKIIGEAGAHHLGTTCEAVSDLDGDGRDELLLGSVYASAAGVGAGSVWLVSGGATNRDEPLWAIVDQARFDGEDTGDAAGTAVGTADLDGDGLDDLLVGAPGVNGDARGAAYLVLASSAVRPGFSLTDADARLDSSVAGDLLGTALATPGDMDGDGREDVVVGAPGDDTTDVDAGAAFLVSGAWFAAGGGDVAVLPAWLGDQAGRGAGRAVDPGGDTDGDGLPEVLIGAPGTSIDGQIWLVQGSLSADELVSDARFSVRSSAPLDFFGFASGAADLDGDSFDDLLIGDDLWDGGTGTFAGALFGFYGGSW